MGELHEVGEAQRGEAVAEARPRTGEAGQLGVRGGEEDDVAGGLPEIDRLGLVDRRAGPGLEEVHRQAGSGFTSVGWRTGYVLPAPSGSRAS